MKRLINILGAGLTATLLSAGVAAAASLGLTSTSTLAAGSAKVTGCTSSALTAIRNVDDNGNVTKVTVINVPQSCSGETLAVTLERASGKSLAGVSTTVGACTGGCAVSFTGFGTISAANIAAYAFSLTP